MNLQELLDNLEPADSSQLEYDVIIVVDVLDIPNLGDSAKPEYVNIKSIEWDHRNNKIFISVPE